MFSRRNQIKINIALINSDNQKRYKRIRPSLNMLKKELSSDFNVEIFEITKQPIEVVCNTWATILSRYLYWKYSREYLEYKGLKQRNILLDVSSIIRRLVLTYFKKSYENWRCGLVILIVNKHIRAWNQFLNNEADLLICFENDAIFNKTSISNLKLLMREAKKHLNEPIYLDFAGGCDPKKLYKSRSLKLKAINCVNFIASL